MAKKQFKAESKKLLDMMINSIYTHKEIFLRELISNSSDAIDKLYYRSLTDNAVGLTRDDYYIKLSVDKENRIITLTDNGCGMTAQELESNLGTIARSGSLGFKNENKPTDNVNIIGQFGVGFYSAFMVSDRVEVESRAYGSNEANRWVSSGADGYTVSPCELDSNGTVITMHIKPNTDNDNYDEFLDSYRISGIVKKYSDYIRYPILMDFETQKPNEDNDGESIVEIETRTLNSMVPLWSKSKTEITAEEYNSFYTEKYYDYEPPLAVIHSKTEGQVTYDALMYIPSHAPFDYYTKEFEKGLQLYSNGVLIMDKCADLLPDYFSFVKGLVDSADLSLNISRELLQHDNQLKLIAKNLEKKIKTELEKLMKNDRDKYEKFYSAFGIQLKYGIYADFGMHKDLLKDLLLFKSSAGDKAVSFKEYIERLADGQDKIFYACSETAEKAAMLPQTESVVAKGYEVLYLTDNVDEFALQILAEYDGKAFVNVCDDKLELGTADETESMKKSNEDNAELLGFMKNSIGESVNAVRFTNKLARHPVCLSSEGAVSVEMEKTLSSMPGDNGIKAQVVLEINMNHPIFDKLCKLYQSDKDKLASYAKILFNEARLISGLTVENPAEFATLICDLM